MAVTGVPNLTELISSQSVEQQTSTKAPAGRTVNDKAAGAIHDTFTLSAAVAQAQPATANSHAVVVVGTPAPTTEVSLTQPFNSSAVAASTVTQIQSLNTVLLTLGLNNTDIQQIDLIAQATKSFNASTYIGVIQRDRTEAAQQKVPAKSQQKAKAATG